MVPDDNVRDGWKSSRRALRQCVGGEGGELMRFVQEYVPNLGSGQPSSNVVQGHGGRASGNTCYVDDDMLRFAYSHVVPRTRYYSTVPRSFVAQGSRAPSSVSAL